MLQALWLGWLSCLLEHLAMFSVQACCKLGRSVEEIGAIEMGAIGMGAMGMGTIGQIGRAHV